MDASDRLRAIEINQTEVTDKLELIMETMNGLLKRINNVNTDPTNLPPPPATLSAPTQPPALPTKPYRMKPAAPTDFDGDRTKGRAFFNSCALYIALCPSEFCNEHAKIFWVLSFMKHGRAAVFADRVLRGRVSFADFEHFESAFKLSFFPEDEATDARMKLESTRYFQGRRSVDSYIDDFEELVELSGYTDSFTIVIKFRRGLDPAIQDKIAELNKERPDDDDPDGWYAAARLFDQNRRANEVFHASAVRKSANAAPSAIPARTMPNVRTPWPRLTSLTSTPTPSGFKPQQPAISKPLPPGVPMDVDAARRAGKIPGNCYRCGETGHRARDCPTGFDVRALSADARDELLEDLLALKDSAELYGGNAEIAECGEGPRPEAEDFVRHSG